MMSPSSPSTGSSLIERLRAQDPKAWDRFVALYGPVVYRWCRQAGLQDQDAADVTQDVLLSVSRAIGGFRHGGPTESLRGWLWTIAHNKQRELFRRRNGRTQAAGGSENLANILQVPEHSLTQTDSLLAPVDAGDVAWRALDLIRPEFDPRTIEAFSRVVIGGRPAADVGAELGMSREAVRMAKSRVLRRLREELGEA